MTLRTRELDKSVIGYLAKPGVSESNFRYDTLPTLIACACSSLVAFVLLHMSGWKWTDWMGVVFGLVILFVAMLPGLLLFLPAILAFDALKLKPIQPAALRKAADLPEKVTALEAEYCRTLATLMEQNTLSEVAGREVVTALSTLLASSRRLEERQKELQNVLSAQDTLSLADEEARLCNRLEGETDPAHRATLEQLLVLNQARQGDEATLVQGAERLRLRQEVILQTVVGLRRTLLRTRLAHQEVAGEDLPQTDTERTTASVRNLQEAVSHLQQQARSIERATQELTVAQG